MNCVLDYENSQISLPSRRTHRFRVSSVSFDLDPLPNSLYTIQSTKFAIEAKSYVRARWRNPSFRMSTNGNKENQKNHYRRKIISCFPFLAAFNSHRKGRSSCKADERIPQCESFLPEMAGESLILHLEDIELLTPELPARATGFPWTLQFCTSIDGYSLHNLYRKLSKSGSPVLLVIEDLRGRVFGGLSSSTLKISDTFFGTSECFLFTCFPQFKVYKWNGDNFYFVEAHEESLAFGSGFGHSGLWLDGDLNKGRTECCLTYGNLPLVPESDFIIKNLECWTFQSPQ